MTYVSTITPNEGRIAMAEAALAGRGGDARIPFSTKFANGLFGAVEVYEETGLAKMVLYDDKVQDDLNLVEGDADDRLFGEWTLDYDGDEYTIKIERP